MKSISPRHTSTGGAGNGSHATAAALARVNPRDTPYKGLMPYDETDAPFFFGRDPEREIITANLMGSRLTLVYGPSGVGKSSVLRAGVVHGLRELARRETAARGRPKTIVVFYPQKEGEGSFNSWRDDPLAGLRAQLRRSVADALGPEPPLCVLPSASLADELKLWADCVGGKVLVVLDQFEEYFLYPQKEGQGSFATELARAVNRADVGANFIISLREDWLAKLDRFKVAIPNLFDNYLRLKWLDAEAARLAIEEPVGLYNRQRAAAEPEVVLAEGFSDKVIEQLGRLSSGDVVADHVGGGAVGAGDTPIQTPYLQLVMTQLWSEALRGDGHALSPEMLRAPLNPKKAKTRAEEIIQSHLDSVMGALSKVEQDAAARAFYHLVTPGGTKIALSVSDLVGFTGVPKGELEPVLEKLSRKETAVLTQLAPPPEHPNDFLYEIFHDVLGLAVLDWRARYLDERRKVEAQAAAEGRVGRQMKRLVVGLAAVVIILAAVTVVAIDSVKRRRDAEAARASLNEAQDKLVIQNREVEIARLALKDKNDELEDKNDELIMAQKVVGQQNIELSEKNERLTSTTAALAAKVEELNKSQGKLAATNRELENKRYQLEEQNAELRQTQGQRDAALAETEKKNRQLEEQNAELVQAQDARKALYENLEKASAVLDKRNKELVRAQAEAKDLLDTIEASDRQTPYIQSVARPGGQPMTATLSENGKHLVGVSSAPDGKSRVVFWDTRNTIYRQLSYLNPGGAALSPDGRYVAQMFGEELRIRDCESIVAKDDPREEDYKKGCAPPTTQRWAGGRFDMAVLDPSGKRLALAGKGAKARIWDIESGQLTNLEGQADGVVGVAFGPGGKPKLLAGAGPDKVAQVWEADTGKLVAELRGHKKPVNSVAFNQDGTQLVTAGADGTAIVWSVKSGKSEVVLRTHRELIIKKKKGIFPVHFNVTQEPRPAIYSAAFSQEGNFVVTGDVQGVVRVWDIQSNTEVRRLNGHYGPVRSVSFSRDGLITSASEDGTVRVWNPCKPEPNVYLGRIGIKSGRDHFTYEYCEKLVKNTDEKTGDQEKK
jgi:hypothetical protein